MSEDLATKYSNGWKKPFHWMFSHLDLINDFLLIFCSLQKKEKKKMRERERKCAKERGRERLNEKWKKHYKVKQVKTTKNDCKKDKENYMKKWHGLNSVKLWRKRKKDETW